jgi:hypothetical protein
MVPEENVLEVEIEPGMRDGQEYPFVAEGNESYSWNSITWLIPATYLWLSQVRAWILSIKNMILTG